MKKQSIIILVFTVIASLLLTVNLSVMVASADDNDSPTASGTETDRSLEEEQSGLISDHETIIAMIRSFIQENQFADAAVCEDSLSGTIVISYYYVHPEQKKAFETFIKENAIDANEITILVMESAIEPKNDDTAVRFELDGNSISGYEGNTEGFMVYGVVDDGAIEYRIADESIAQIEYVDNKQVSILYLAPGSTVLTATTSDGKTVLELEVVVWPIEKEPVSEMLVNELYFNSQYGYVPVEIGLNSGISLAGYDDGIFYEVGESPIEFTIDDEQIAEIGLVQGIGVNVFGVSAGETTLHAKAPDGRTASIKVVVTEAPPVSTTARNEAATSADPGDVNMDGKVNSADARLALRASAKLEELSDEQKQLADMNKDGKVNSSDARTILRTAAKLETVS